MSQLLTFLRWIFEPVTSQRMTSSSLFSWSVQNHVSVPGASVLPNPLWGHAHFLVSPDPLILTYLVLQLCLLKGLLVLLFRCFTATRCRNCLCVAHLVSHVETAFDDRNSRGFLLSVEYETVGAARKCCRERGGACPQKLKESGILRWKHISGNNS